MNCQRTGCGHSEQLHDRAGKCWACACERLIFDRAHENDPTPEPPKMIIDRWTHYGYPTTLCGLDVDAGNSSTECAPTGEDAAPHWTRVTCPTCLEHRALDREATP